VNTAGVWALDPEVVFLNHGSLGSCPRPVLEDQQQWRSKLEASPVQFMLRELNERLATVRSTLAARLGADPADIALLTNATAGVNTVLRSIDLGPGDDILLTTHEYNACSNAVEYAAHRSGATVTRAVVPFPLSEPDDVLNSVLDAVGPRTKIALVSHLTSATAVVFPIRELVQELQGRGIDVIVDGAHAPGQLDLDIEAVGAAYYAGNCHKWLCCPKGTGFLHVRKDRQERIHPLVISHGSNDPRTEIPLFRREFDWQGTYDPTPFLSIPAAIETLDGLDRGGISGLRTRNHTLALQARDMLCDVLDVAAPVPDSMMGAMTTVPIDHLFLDGHAREALFLSLRDTYRIEVPIMGCRLDLDGPPRWVLRVSCQAYNEPDDIDALRLALLASIP
jgi:isopenicillin-N epimerase